MTPGRLFASLALVALAPGAAAAQFTTFVAPPPKVDTVIVADTAVVVTAPTADSLARANINNMKAWVDSAAGDAVDLRTEPVAVAPMPEPGYFADGSPAPNTATPLPLLVVLGAGAIGAGALLLRRS